MTLVPGTKLGPYEISAALVRAAWVRYIARGCRQFASDRDAAPLAEHAAANLSVGQGTLDMLVLKTLALEPNARLRHLFAY